MMKFVSVTSALVLGATTPSFAGTLEQAEIDPMVETVTMAPAPTYGRDWTGGYAGIQLGLGQVDVDPDGADLNGDGALYGVHAGYMYDLGRYVLGGELDYDLTEIESTELAGKVDSVLRLKGRVGYDAGAILPYMTAGFAQTDASDTALGGVDDGYLFGVGAVYAMRDTILVGGEVLQHSFDDFDGTGFDVDAMTATARVSFKF